MGYQNKYNNRYQQALKNGKYYLFKNNNEQARRCFEVATSNFKFRNQAIGHLIDLDLREGKYKHARTLLEENYNEEPNFFAKKYGLLENIENNFEASKTYYNQKIEEGVYLEDNLLGMAKIYIQH